MKKAIFPIIVLTLLFFGCELSTNREQNAESGVQAESSEEIPALEDIIPPDLPENIGCGFIRPGAEETT